MEGEALYPFGYGLSYGSFSYRDLWVETGDWDKKEKVQVKVKVKNTSSWDCWETVEIYVKLIGSPLAVPNYSLVQFRKVYLTAGEERELTLEVKTRCFQVVDQSGERKWDNTKTVIYAGTSQPDERSISLTGQRPLALTVQEKERF